MCMGEKAGRGEDARRVFREGRVLCPRKGESKGPAFALAGPSVRYQTMYCFVLASYSSSVAARKPVRAPLSSRTA